MALHSRVKRIGEEIRNNIAIIIMRELKDPRLGDKMVTVSNVTVSKDLHVALVWISVLGDDEQTKAVMEGLNASKGYIKHLLNERMVLKFMPDLQFRLDTSTRYAARINDLLNQIGTSQAAEKSAEPGEE